MIEFDLRTISFIVTQVVTVAVLISANKIHISALKEASAEQKKWLKEVQNQLIELRVKVGA